MNIYYIDYENVSSQGLKGIEALTENDEVNLLYSKKADNVKIEILTMLMASRAKIHFLPVHVGTPNALDFQLVTLLFLNYRPENYCYIISKDSGYDCCIKTAAENGAPNVARYPNIESALNKTPVKKTRRGKQTGKDTEPSILPAPNPHVNASSPNQDSGSVQTPALSPAEDAELITDALQDASATADDASHVQEETAKKKTSRRRGRKKGSASENEQEEAMKLSGGDNTASKNTESGKKQGSEKAESGKKQNTEKSDSGKKQNTEKSDSGKKQNAEKSDPGKKQNVEKSDSGKKPVQERGQDASESSKTIKPSGSNAKPETEKPSESGSASEHNPLEHVLSQRYLSNRFEQRNPLITSAGTKSDAEKPVSILSVIRRRNDVQLDMHQIDLIRNALKNSGNKQQFYSYFVKNLGQKQGIELYQSVKSSYTDLVNANLL